MPAGGAGCPPGGADEPGGGGAALPSFFQSGRAAPGGSLGSRVARPGTALGAVVGFTELGGADGMAACVLGLTSSFFAARGGVFGGAGLTSLFGSTCWAVTGAGKTAAEASRP